MTKAKISPDEMKARVAQIEQLVRACGGMEATEVCRAIKRGRDYTFACLRQTNLVKYRLVATGKTLWLTKEDHALRKAATKEKQRHRESRRRINLEVPDVKDEIQRRYIKAGDAPMPTTRAANSVWQWRPAA